MAGLVAGITAERRFDLIGTVLNASITPASTRPTTRVTLQRAMLDVRLEAEILETPSFYGRSAPLLCCCAALPAAIQFRYRKADPIDIWSTRITKWRSTPS